MGESNSKPKEPSTPISRAHVKEKEEIEEAKTSGDLRISASDFITFAIEPFGEVYTTKEVLGYSVLGETRKIVHKTTGVVRTAKIVKKANLTEQRKAFFLNEVDTIRRLDHPNIMKIYELFQDKAHYYLIGEYLDGGELFERISKRKTFSEAAAANIIKQVLSAIAYCHKQNVVHRDLKPELLVFESRNSEANLKIVEFEAATNYKENTKLTQLIGSYYYIAPEVLKRDYSKKCDIWSIGVILYILLGGRPPFEGQNKNEIVEKIKKGKYNFDQELWSNVSEEAKKLVSRMMEYDPEKRCSAEEALQDPWFSMVLEKEEINHPIAKENLEKLRNFEFESKMQEATWVFMVSYFSTKEDKNNLLETFKALDQNGDGVLSKQELIEGYVNIMGMTEAEAIKEAENIMKTLDGNNSGHIDYTEFVNATISKVNVLKKENLEAVFKIFDKDGDGHISPVELRFLFNEAKSQGVPEEVWKEWIKQVDKNSDGGVTYPVQSYINFTKLTIDEFKDMMVSLMNKY